MEFLSLLLSIGLIVLIFASLFKICRKLKYSKGMSALLTVLLFIPFIGMVTLIYLGFSKQRGSGE